MNIFIMWISKNTFWSFKKSPESKSPSGVVSEHQPDQVKHLLPVHVAPLLSGDVSRQRFHLHVHCAASLICTQLTQVSNPKLVFHSAMAACSNAHNS